MDLLLPLRCLFPSSAFLSLVTLKLRAHSALLIFLISPGGSLLPGEVSGWLQSSHGPGCSSMLVKFGDWASRRAKAAGKQTASSPLLPQPPPEDYPTGILQIETLLKERINTQRQQTTPKTSKLHLKRRALCLDLIEQCVSQILPFKNVLLKAEATAHLVRVLAYYLVPKSMGMCVWGGGLLGMVLRR